MATVTTYGLDKLKEIVPLTITRVSDAVFFHTDPIVDAIKEGIVENEPESASGGYAMKHMGDDADRRVKDLDGNIVSDAMYQDVAARRYDGLDFSEQIVVGNSEYLSDVAQGQDLGWGNGGSGKKPAGARFNTVYGAHWMDSALPVANDCIDIALKTVRRV